MNGSMVKMRKYTRLWAEEAGRISPVWIWSGGSGKGESGFGWAGIHADFSSASPTFEFDHAAHLGKQRMIPSEVHIESREKLGAALTDDDTPGRYGLTAIGFHAEILWIAVPAVT